MNIKVLSNSGSLRINNNKRNAGVDIAVMFIKNINTAFLLTLLFSSLLKGQGKGYDFQSYMISNPAAAGSEGTGTARLSYINYYPGNSYKLHNISFSYDSYFQALHGGIGFYISDYYQGGVINDLSGGFAYSYHFRAGSETFIRAGLSSAFFHRGYSTKGLLLPDQIDPSGGPAGPTADIISARNRTLFDLSTGFMVHFRKLNAGLSVSHLTQPEIADGKGFGDRLRRELIIFMSGDFNLPGNQSLIIKPVLRADIQDDNTKLAAGTVISGGSLAFNTIIAAATQYKDADLQAGLSFAINGVRLYYSYRFNLVSGENLVPVQLFHQTGVTLSLNNVDKRKTVKTIIFPEL